MSELAVTIPIGIGDIIYVKAMLDAVKHRYDTIKIKFHREIVRSYNFDPNYNSFLDDIGALFFSESPYVLTDEPGIPFYGVVSICTDNQITPLKPSFKNLLCKGSPLQLDGEYIVMVTKSRDLPKEDLDARVMEMWQVLQEVSKKYKVVILGEREVQMHQGYVDMGPNNVYSIYSSIIDHIPNDRLLDLSLPALGINSPSLTQIRQDCLTMSGAKFVLTLGIGGGFCLATAVGNTIGYRWDNDPIADVVFSKQYEDAMVTKEWSKFISTLKRYTT